MPSTVVHLALGGLIAAALLRDSFGIRSLAVVAVLVIVPDLDAFAGLVIEGGHRSLLHTLLFPLALAGLIVYDTHIREASWLKTRFDGHGPRVAWVGILAISFAAIGPDLFGVGANIFYPIHDQFYAFDGRIELSNQRGLVQTFVDLAPEPVESGGGSGGGGDIAVGSTEEVHISSGIDPQAGDEPANVERMFPIVRSGQQLLLVLTSIAVVGVRLAESRILE
ncbi:metal-dependent hydrolase [Halorhabdus rudnickae]|uniref:metal-dependent hydrolase n=1 Tax=Halorhabdus rudnickae TaxID=1775544 RepID=UPI001082E7A9|nr:metal-dependent hydrolase [Halorhabdus rudnickae]